MVNIIFKISSVSSNQIEEGSTPYRSDLSFWTKIFFFVNNITESVEID